MTFYACQNILETKPNLSDFAEFCVQTELKFTYEHLRFQEFVRGLYPQAPIREEGRKEWEGGEEKRRRDVGVGHPLGSPPFLIKVYAYVSHLYLACTQLGVSISECNKCNVGDVLKF